MNQWNNGTHGNYWGDYIAKYPLATNNETVWDTGYEIDGDGGGVDGKPLVDMVLFEFIFTQIFLCQ